MKYPHRSGKFHPSQLSLPIAGLALFSALSCAPGEADESVTNGSAALTLGPVNVLTRNYDNGRTGANTQEQSSSPAT